jgi:DNA-directed RNA polymerase subunit RPC12/RpoP
MRRALRHILAVIATTTVAVILGCITAFVLGRLTRRPPNLLFTGAVCAALGAGAGVAGSSLPYAIGGVITGLLVGSVTGNGYLVDSLAGAVGGAVTGFVVSEFARRERAQAAEAAPADQHVRWRFICRRCKAVFSVAEKQLDFTVVCPKCGSSD